MIHIEFRSSRLQNPDALTSPKPTNYSPAKSIMNLPLPANRLYNIHFQPKKENSFNTVPYHQRKALYSLSSQHHRFSFKTTHHEKPSVRIDISTPFLLDGRSHAQQTDELSRVPYTPFISYNILPGYRFCRRKQAFRNVQTAGFGITNFLGTGGIVTDRKSK